MFIHLIHQLQTRVDFFDHGATVRRVEDVERCDSVLDGHWRMGDQPVAS